jgi:hypothetical protein
MDRKLFDGIFVLVPIILASQIAMATSDSLLSKLGFSTSNFNQIIAGTVIGSVVGVGAWLAMVLIARLFGKGKNNS